MALIYNASFDSQTRVLSLLDKAGNVVSSCEVPSKELVDDITKPLTFRATQDGCAIELFKQGSPSGSFETSRDGGSTWEDYTIGRRIVLNTGDEVSFRAKADRSKYQYASNHFYFVMGGKIEAWHNVMSLYHTNDFATCDTAVGSLFAYLFENCTSLTKAPILPATTLEDSCYYHMFSGCESLTKAPELPATTLAQNCCANMFSGCTSLIKAPELPVTTLAQCYYCYRSMFSGCQSLTKAPELPATTLANNCYSNMFSGCQSLTKAPELPATALANNCYSSMFSGCQSLKEVRVSATTTADSSLQDWLSGVSATGDFYCDPNATIFQTDSASGIPAGWTRVPAVDDVTKPLTLKATQDGSTVKLKKQGSPSGSFETSRDGGSTWTDYTIDTAISLNTGNEVSFRAKSDRSAQNATNYFHFEMTGKIEAWHNVMSMSRTSDFATYNTATSFAFYRLFQGCTSLTKAPVLPATTLAGSCYYDMFGACESLTKAPELPATTLAQSCYNGIFYSCSSLTKAPELPATTLADDCYGYMFSGCRNLNEVHCQMPSSYSSSQISSYAKDWLRDVSSTGTFYTNSDANWSSGASGIPENWTRVNERAKDDITKPLTFKATQDGSTVKLTKLGSPVGDFQTSTDGGNTWTDYTLKTAITLNTGDEVSFRAKENRTSAQTYNDYFKFMMEGKIEAWHNVMSLYRTSDFATYNTVMSYAFADLFNSCSSLTKAPVLPATTLALRCYYRMFYGCQSLTKAPVLPAATLAIDCYNSMFYECRSLKEVRVSATTTAEDALYKWLYRVSATGDFYCDPNATIFPTDSVSGIPSGWTRHALADYPTT